MRNQQYIAVSSLHTQVSPSPIPPPPCMIRASCSNAEFCSDCSNEVDLTISNNLTTDSFCSSEEGMGGGRGQERHTLNITH